MAETWIDDAVKSLEGAGLTNPDNVCRWTLEHVLNETISIHQPMPSLSPDECLEFSTLIARVVKGEPLQYVLGSTEFFNCTINVGPGVLIPRPETEQLVDLALNTYSGRGDVLDLCTGSGCIPLAMAVERPAIPRLVGVDCSDEALRWADVNRRALGVDNVEFNNSDLFAAVKGQRFEMITANPPYISRDDDQEVARTVKDYEPELALFADDDGMAILDRIVSQASDYLLDGGWLMCEIGYDQGARTHQLFEKHAFTCVHVHKDYAGLDRIVSGKARG